MNQLSTIMIYLQQAKDEIQLNRINTNFHCHCHNIHQLYRYTFRRRTIHINKEHYTDRTTDALAVHG